MRRDLISLGLFGIGLIGIPESTAWPTTRERGSYQARVASTGKILWDTSWEATRVQEEDRSVVEIQEQGQGQPLAYQEPILWEKRMVMQITPQLLVRSMQGSRWNRQGKLLSRLDFQVDPIRQRILYQDGEPNQPSAHVTLPLTPQTVPDELLFHWVRTLAFDRKPAGECLLVASPTRRFRMRAFVRGTEEITTPAGTFSCHRVELVPRLGPLEILPVKRLVPKVTLWCSVEPPHFWVRYQGPVGGSGSPQAIIELTRFEQEQPG